MKNSIYVNELIQWNLTDGESLTERILWLDEYAEYAYVINIYSDKGLPILRKTTEIYGALDNYSAVKLKVDVFIRNIIESEIKVKDKELRDRAWDIISSIVDSKNEPAVYKLHGRSELIKEAMEKHGITYRSIYKYLRRYWQRGKIKNALLPDYYKSGNKGIEKKPGDKKLGRPRKIGVGINVDEETKKIFRVAINRYYHTSKKNPIATAYELMVKDFYVIDYKFEGGIRKPIIADIDQMPTLNQFKYWYEKELNIRKAIASRKGAKKFELNHRAILGKSDTYVMGPGAIYQIDATIGDVYLVSSFNRKWIIGRPVIYAVIDVFSRMITGIYVGLEGPSLIGAMMALANATTDKIKFCKEYGINIDEEEWPCFHTPESIIGDRGELESKGVENYINGLQVKINNTPPYRADWKGIIEQYFHTINGYVKPLVPGSINVDFRQRGGTDYRLDAKLNLYEFTQIIIKCALYHNNEHWLNYYDRNETMIEDDVEKIPSKLWSWGIKNRSGKLRIFPEDIIRLNLMPSDRALVSTKGIIFKGVGYGCESALKEMWFEKARNKGSWHLDISYDTRNMNYIYIRSEDGRSFEKCSILERNSRYMNKSLEEIEYLNAYEQLMSKKHKIKELQEKVDLLSDIEHIVKKAEYTTNKVQDKNASKASRLKNIKENRRNEKLANREREAFILEDKNDKLEGKVIKPKQWSVLNKIDI
ncbi:Mu transposase C-terminal domain-containing protein [Clostridium sp. DJ247]|uniref:Mu transposase C-terminal domain-containing protein n=1 Tax=Clostridium sp. DJ247 TaxID=2726188 RepID=UPI001625C4A4|nr:Mu transposase C-terminal domain-containing protein [Clostridium sp. DJ247]MBC2579589.1 transposase family protein [Clostridium sp. DJ247]